MPQADLRTVTLWAEFRSEGEIFPADPIVLCLPQNGLDSIDRRRLLIAPSTGRVTARNGIWRIRQEEGESQQKFRPRIDGLLRYLMISAATDLHLEEARDTLTARQRRAAALKRPAAPANATNLETWVMPDKTRIAGATFHVSDWADRAIAHQEASGGSWHEIDWSVMGIARRHILFGPAGLDARLAAYAAQIRDCAALQAPRAGRVKGPPL